MKGKKRKNHLHLKKRVAEVQEIQTLRLNILVKAWESKFFKAVELIEKIK